ncbi:MAG: hypothetical protein J1F20_07240 [Muribaculaceae bacterium]|nr:hypothetical protein [Muribaculaceae bacterium]
MKVVKVLILVLVNCLFAKFEAKGQGEISVNFPSLQVQYDVIHEDGYIYGNQIIDWLMGKSIRAFIAWSRQFTGENYDVLMFSILPSYPSAEYKIPEGLSVPVPYDEEAELRREKASKEINKYRFETYPQYECCNMHELLDGNKIFLNVEPSLMEFPIRLHYKITAFIPCTNDDIMPSMNDNKKDLEKRFYRLVMWYDYEPRAHLDKYEGTTDEKVYSFFKEQIVKGYDSVNDTLSFKSSKYIKWDVNISFVWATLETFDETNMPKRINDLFPYRMFQ